MATNPIGKGTKTIGINMDAKLADELEKRAESMYIQPVNTASSSSLNGSIPARSSSWKSARQI